MIAPAAVSLTVVLGWPSAAKSAVSAAPGPAPASTPTSPPSTPPVPTSPVTMTVRTVPALPGIALLFEGVVYKPPDGNVHTLSR